MLPDIHPVLIVLVLPAVIGLVTMLKDLGMPTKLGAPASVLLAVVGGVAFYLYGEHDLFTIVLTCILLGLGASGLYDLSKLIGGQLKPAVTVSTPAAPVIETHIAGAPDAVVVAMEREPVADWRIEDDQRP